MTGGTIDTIIAVRGKVHPLREDSLVWRDVSSIGTSSHDRERVEERIWLDRCAAGDERAVRWFLSRYRERAVRLAAHVLRDSRDAEDVAQEAFVRAFKQIRKFRGDSGFYVWLYRIVVNICLDKMRRKGSGSEVPLEIDFADPDMHGANSVEQKLSIEQALSALSPPIRAALILREVEGLEYVEIAAVLSIPVGTVRSRLNSGREQFRQRWIALQEEIDGV